MPKFLIDVRSPAEYTGGYLEDAINIEYTRISELAPQTGALPDDQIILYCRSGRRSAIALTELRRLGFTNARDIGSFEKARETLEEEKRRKLGYETRISDPGSRSLRDGHGGMKSSSNDIRNDFNALLKGLGAVDSTGSGL